MGGAFRYRFFGEKAPRPRRGGGGDGVGGDPCGRPRLWRWKDEGRSGSRGDDIHKGPIPTSHPLPPLRGRESLWVVPDFFILNVLILAATLAFFVILAPTMSPRGKLLYSWRS